MKKYMPLIMLLWAMSFMACSSDDDAPEKTVIDRSMIEGEWFSDDSNTYLSMAYSSFQGVVYGELDAFPIEGEIITGKWIYVPKTQIVRLTIHYAISSSGGTRDFKLLHIDDYTMTLLDIDLNAEYTYHKVLSHKTLDLGEEFDISVEGVSPTDYKSISPNIVKVSNKGRVKARSNGTAFIYAESGEKSFFTRVDVSERPLCYLQELFGSIDDILARYGTPNWSGDTESPSKVIVYADSINDTRLKYMHYRYDAETREITQIVTQYAAAEGYWADIETLKKSFIDIYGDGSVFGEEAYLTNNMYIIQPMTNGTDYIFYYSNVLYYLQHQYY